MWEYREVPAALLLPACPHCSNRGRVLMILRAVIVCGDCGKPFVAVWRDQQPVAVGEVASAGGRR